MSSAFDSIADVQGMPASVHIEIAILGAMLLDGVAIDDATAKLKDEDFSLDSHRRVYRSIVDLAAQGRGVDSLTVQEELIRRRQLDSIGGPAYLAFLTEGIPRNLNIESYVQIVRDKSLLRAGMEICQRGMTRCMDGGEDALTILSETEAELANATAEVTIEPSLVDQSDAEFELLERQRMGEMLRFIPSGLDFFDVSHGGFAKGEMTVIGARPGVGKSTLLRQAIIANCEEGNFVHLFSPEMQAGQILRCLWAAVARIPFHKLRHPERMTAVDEEYVRAAKKAIAKWPLQIDATSPISATEIIARSRSTKRKHGTALVGVDYLQKLRYRGRAQDRHVEVTDAMVALTALAKNEDVALAVVSSITEGTGKQRNRVPTIDDLRQSGDIKYEANTVLLLHRELDAETRKLSPKTQFIVGKARSEMDGSGEMFFDGAMQRFDSQQAYLRGIGK